MNREKIKTTVNIEVKLLNELKSIANNKKSTPTEVSNDLLKKGIIFDKKENTKGNNFMKMAGIVSAPEKFNAIEDVG